MDKICIEVLREKMGLDLPEGVEGTLIIEVDGAEPAVKKDMEKIVDISNEFDGIDVHWSDKPEEFGRAQSKESPDPRRRITLPRAVRWSQRSR